MFKLIKQYFSLLLEGLILLFIYINLKIKFKSKISNAFFPVDRIDQMGLTFLDKYTIKFYKYKVYSFYVYYKYGSITVATVFEDNLFSFLQKLTFTLMELDDE